MVSQWGNHWDRMTFFSEGSEGDGRSYVKHKMIKLMVNTMLFFLMGKSGGNIYLPYASTVWFSGDLTGYITIFFWKRLKLRYSNLSQIGVQHISRDTHIHHVAKNRRNKYDVRYLMALIGQYKWRNWLQSFTFNNLFHAVKISSLQTIPCTFLYLHYPFLLKSVC